MLKWVLVRKVAVVLSGFALFLSVLPMLQFIGGWLGLLAFALATFALKRRPSNEGESISTQDSKIVHRARRRAGYAIALGLAVAGFIRMQSWLCTIRPMQSDMETLREGLKKEIAKTAAEAEERFEDAGIDASFSAAAEKKQNADSDDDTEDESDSNSNSNSED